MQSPHTSSDPEINNPKTRRPAHHTLPYRRSNASLTNLFASTTSLPTPPRVQSPSDSGTVTPPTAAAAANSSNGSVFSPGGSTVRSPSPSLPSRPSSTGKPVKDVILRAFSPHVSVLASEDTEELVRHKGIHGGLLELLRPFGERVPGKVTIRDSTGASRSWEDFAVRFIAVQDGLESPRGPANRTSVDSAGSRNGERPTARSSSVIAEYKPARLRTGGDVAQIEELVERHLTFSEEQSGPFQEDYLNFKTQPADPDAASSSGSDPSPFYLLYLRRLLSGLPLVPSETFSHPVASIIAISSRSSAPIEDLRSLYASSNAGAHRLPHWVHNEFLRYYVLIHDEDYDDMNKSMQLYEQMKRHFGLHCHLLRLRSVPAVKNSEMDEVTRLGMGMEWMAAAEELAEITRRENLDDDNPDDNDDDDTTGGQGDLSLYLFETDAANLRAFVREMVTQSLIPSMERASSTWNDSVASRRRGLSGRFMSLSKRFTTFGSSAARTTSSAAASALSAASTGNYDSLQGFYRPDAPEATMRRLADYAMMLRDWRLAQGTYEILCQDFKTDKAWKHYAAANEMAAVSSLITGGGSAAGSKLRVDAVDQYLETAYYSYITRVGAPYHALRTLVLAVELLKLRGGSVGLEAAAKWAERIVEDRLAGPVGHVLLMERIATCYDERKAGSGGEKGGEKVRKAAFWKTLACDAWLQLDKGSRAEACLKNATRLYDVDAGHVHFKDMQSFLRQLQHAVEVNRSGPQHIDGADLLAASETQVETLQDEPERLPRRPSVGGVLPVVPSMHGAMHRKSLSANIPALPQLQTPRSSFDPLAAPAGLPPSAYDNRRPSMERLRTPTAGTPGMGFGGAAGAAVLSLSPHAEELSPASPTPRSAMRRGLSGSFERRDPRDDGFE